ncbi:nuclear transport factor 2 family protein [Photobacterium chitinilyticum]|uniref:Nuclear transport factor 2 family protein n=1 Tax=Photobacterium chitinilyticum TaxID=2485123 RepID=A0A3S3S3Q9_9GAMM|nr:nuclear transport factor 2 family protein [Photobacterium chitinilyticum]RWX57486.1 nuclear transport factor 2 family protein [Photobacterium chitinilyticum]
METRVPETFKTGIELWKKSFNQQDAAGCAAQYTANAVMHARPFGTFTGTEEIRAFWQQIIDSGYASVEYQNTSWEQKDSNCFILRSEWTMNKAFGAVHEEHWIIQPDGTAKLEYDDFEVLGER